MNTTLQKPLKNDVGDCDRPRDRPRGGTLCVGVPYGGTAHHINVAHVPGRESPTSIAHVGGLHRSPAGLTTFDSLTDAELREDHQRRLADFEAELAEVTSDYGYRWPGNLARDEARLLEEFEAGRARLQGEEGVAF